MDAVLVLVAGWLAVSAVVDWLIRLEELLPGSSAISHRMMGTAGPVVDGTGTSDTKCS